MQRQDEGLQKLEAERTDGPGALARAPAPDPEERVAALTRALATTCEREADFRQAAFDLNAELLRKDAEIETLRERLDAADGQAAASRARLAELERLTQTRAFRAATWWWRLKAAIRRR